MKARMSYKYSNNTLACSFAFLTKSSFFIPQIASHELIERGLFVIL